MFPVSMVAGFVLRYVPKVFGFVGDGLKAKQERKDEAFMVRLQMGLETKRAAAAGKSAVIQGEIAESLAGIQAESTKACDLYPEIEAKLDIHAEVQVRLREEARVAAQARARGG